jgi:hypothetical protein
MGIGRNRIDRPHPLAKSKAQPAGAEGIYARVANQVFHSVEAVEARAPAHGTFDRRGRGQNRSIAAPAGLRTSRFFLQPSHFFFSTTPPNFLKPESSNLEVTQ